MLFQNNLQILIGVQSNLYKYQREGWSTGLTYFIAICFLLIHFVIIGWEISQSGIEELIPVYRAKYVLDVNIETKEHWKSMYFEKVGLKQRWTNSDKSFEYSFEPWSGSTKENIFYNSFS